MRRGVWLEDKSGRMVAAIDDGKGAKPVSEPKPAKKDGD